MRNPAPAIATLLLGALIIFLILRPQKTAPPAPEPPPAPAPTDLSILAEPPDWPSLAAYQHTITRSDFQRLLTEIFTTDDTWRSYISIGEASAVILTSTDAGATPFVLEFATTDKNLPVPRTWLDTRSLPIPPPGKPLANLHIAIDPGHIGGEWAQMEARWFRIGNDMPVTEGDMSLRVGKILKPLLEQLGAKVSLIRTTAEPITPLRPENLVELAAQSPSGDPQALRKFSESLFYRTAEIRARAKLANETIKPDLVLCLHFNAEAWGDSANPALVPRTHFHIILNGAYTSDEIHLSDQRFAMLEKLLQRTHEEEAQVGKTVAATFAEISKLPPYIYSPDDGNVRPVGANPYLWARNLLANRLYDSPVIYMEPYVMNSTIDYPRFQAGDYEGLREINGQQLPSIYREYATALAKGLANHYSR